MMQEEDQVVEENVQDVDDDVNNFPFYNGKIRFSFGEVLYKVPVFSDLSI